VVVSGRLRPGGSRSLTQRQEGFITARSDAARPVSVFTENSVSVNAEKALHRKALFVSIIAVINQKGGAGKTTVALN